MHYARALTATLAAGAAAAVLAGCAGTDTSTADQSTPPPKPSAETSTAAPHNDADVAFAQGMIPHHRQAIEMSRLAAQRAQSEEVKKLANQIEAAQAPEIKTLTGWLRQWGVPVSAKNMPSKPNMNDGDMGQGSMGHDGMGMMSPDQMQQLTKASGAEFDRMFLTMMIKHHQGAVTMAQTELRNGQYPPAKQLAQKIIDTQQAEIATMKNLLAQR